MEPGHMAIPYVGAITEIELDLLLIFSNYPLQVISLTLTPSILHRNESPLQLPILTVSLK